MAQMLYQCGDCCDRFPADEINEDGLCCECEYWQAEEEECDED